MNKYFGMVGIMDECIETQPGIYNSGVVERPYYGDFERRSFRNDQSTQTTNDNLTLNYTLSLKADDYAIEHCFDIKYVIYKGYKWRVTSVDDSERPRLKLQFGGVYREDEA